MGRGQERREKMEEEALIAMVPKYGSFAILTEKIPLRWCFLVTLLHTITAQVSQISATPLQTFYGSGDR
jgi:hypothetical protein